MNQCWTTILFVYHQEIFNNCFATVVASNYDCRLNINNTVHTHPTWSSPVSKQPFLTSPLHFSPISSFSILGIVYHFSFSTSLPITVDIPTAHRRNPCGQEGKGHGLPRDPCDRNHTRHATIYCHTRCVQPLSFVYRPAILSRAARFTVSPLRWISALLLLLSSAFHGKRTTNTCSEFPPLFDLCLPLPMCCSLSLPNPLCLSLRIFLFLSPSPLPPFSLLSRLLPRSVLCQRLLSAA